MADSRFHAQLFLLFQTVAGTWRTDRNSIALPVRGRKDMRLQVVVLLLAAPPLTTIASLYRPPPSLHCPLARNLEIRPL
jgi:hypothetical protein